MITVVALALKITNSFKPPYSSYWGIWFEFVKAVPLRTGPSRLYPRQLIPALKEWLGEPKAVLQVGRLARVSGQHRNKLRVCSTPSLVKDFLVEALEVPTPCPRLTCQEGKDMNLGRKQQGELMALYSKGKMISHCFLEFKSTSFWINIFFNRIFLLFLKDVKTITPISSNTRLYILTRFSQAFFGYL